LIYPDFSYKIYNHNILHLEWTEAIDNEQMRKINHFAKILNDQNQIPLIDIVPAYHSLSVFLNDPIVPISELINSLGELYHLTSSVPAENGKLWKIPVVYGGSRGQDFDTVCKKINMDPEELIEKHTAPLYEVHFIGFLPGFPYLGGLDPELHISRKEIPTASILAGSVGIGGSQTGIYSVNSPGGWNIIGNTPFPLFDPKRSPQTLIQSNDRIQFYSIKESELEGCRMKICEEIQKSLTN
jgi:inhibitor of KinA